ncbi:hypothetical protein ACJX0J_008526, partial [Zea mays]
YDTSVDLTIHDFSKGHIGHAIDFHRYKEILIKFHYRVIRILFGRIAAASETFLVYQGKVNDCKAEQFTNLIISTAIIQSLIFVAIFFDNIEAFPEKEKDFHALL